MCNFKKTNECIGKKPKLDNLYASLQSCIDEYESPANYCYLVAYFDDGIRNISFPSNICRSTTSINGLIDVIPIYIKKLMEKPERLRFILFSIEKKHLFSNFSRYRLKKLIDEYRYL